MNQEQQPVPTDTARLPGNGHSRQTQLSSNHTLFWRVFVPIFGTVFLAGFLIAFVLTAEDELYLPFPVLWARLGIAAILLAWVLLVRSTVWRLTRLDADDAFIYVTNYWTTVRYPWADVARIDEKKRAGRRIIQLQLRAPGRFGQKISFLPSTHFFDWMAEHQKQALLVDN